MRILLSIHEKLDLNSGAAGSTLRIGKEYQKLGHEVYYYSFDDLPSIFPLKVKELVFPEFVAFKISQSIDKFNIDVVDASTSDAWLWAKVLRNLNKKAPVLITRSHGLEHIQHLQDMEEAIRGDLKLSWKYPLYRGSIQLWEVAESIKLADSVYLLNTQEKKYVVEHFEVNPDRAYIFPNGIPEYLINLPFKPLDHNAEVPIKIAQISTYITRKGIKYSSSAINNILNRYPQVEVSFLGTECPECPDVEQVYADFAPNIRDRITVIPRFNHEALPHLLKGHHIKLLPSLSEGFGKALIEAMACGLAPITTATSGPLEIVTNDHDGVIIPPRSSNAIEQALERLISDQIYLNSLRYNAYKTSQKYSWKTTAENRLSIYQQNLKSKNKQLCT
ncbi:MAG: glycosyltransferase family 4 protein [Cyanobacteria bacterium P01_A01_bin.40]